MHDFVKCTPRNAIVPEYHIPTAADVKHFSDRSIRGARLEEGDSPAGDEMKEEGWEGGISPLTKRFFN